MTSYKRAKKHIEAFEKMYRTTDSINLVREISPYIVLEDLCDAIEAIEKQIPQTANDMRVLDKGDKYKYGKCPACGEGACNEMRFCSNCGQALEWNDNDK